MVFRGEGWGKNICQSVIEDGRNEHETSQIGVLFLIIGKIVVWPMKMRSL